LPDRFTPGRGFVNARLVAYPVFTPGAAYGVIENPATAVQQVVRFEFTVPEFE